MTFWLAAPSIAECGIANGIEATGAAADVETATNIDAMAMNEAIKIFLIMEFPPLR